MDTWVLQSDDLGIKKDFRGPVALCSDLVTL